MIDAAPHIATGSKKSLAFVFALVAVDMIGFGIIMPVLPSLIVELTGKSIAEAARYGGWLAFTYAVMQFVFGPVIGNLSDRFGRRPVLIAAILAFSVNYTLMGFAPTLFWLFAGRVVAGITGASFSGAYAYVADVSPPEKRAQNFGLIGMAFGLGFIIGPAIGGILGEFDTRLPFYAAGALAFANAVYGYFFLEESLSVENRRPFSLRRSHAISTLAALGRENKAILWFAAAMLAWQTGHQAFPTVWSFFAIERLNWSELDIGLSLAAVGVTSALVQGGLIRIAIPKLGVVRAAVIGIVAMVIAFVMYAAAESGIVVYAAILVGALAGFAYPSINSLMSQNVKPDMQGALQGAVASLSSLAAVIGPPLMAESFAAYSGGAGHVYFPGAPFVLAAFLSLLCLGLFLAGARSIDATISRTA